MGDAMRTSSNGATRFCDRPRVDGVTSSGASIQWRSRSNGVRATSTRRRANGASKARISIAPPRTKCSPSESSSCGHAALLRRTRGNHARCSPPTASRAIASSTGCGPTSTKLSHPAAASECNASAKRTVPRICCSQYDGDDSSPGRAALPLRFVISGMPGSANCTPRSARSNGARTGSMSAE